MTNTHARWLKTLMEAAASAVGEAGRLPVYFDIGARDGLAPAWDLLARLRLVTAIGFEPDEAHCGELAERDGHVRYVCAALGDEIGERTLHRTRMPGCSSFREPNYALLKQYPASVIFDPVGTAAVAVTTLERVSADESLLPPDFLKIDTQGFEMEILGGAGALLEHITGIELEAQFKPMYKGQALLPEIMTFLGAKGFILRELRPSGPYEGELVEVDAFFSKRPTLDRGVALLRLWQITTELASPLFLSQIEDWRPEWLTGLTEDQVVLRRALFGS